MNMLTVHCEVFTDKGPLLEPQYLQYYGSECSNGHQL